MDETSTDHGTRHRLLLIEDNPGDAGLISEHLLDLRWGSDSLVVAETLAEGLQHLTEESFACVLLDLNLPDSSGLETLERVVAFISATPVIVLTGAGAEDMGVRALASGASDFMPKDELDGRLLDRAVRYAMERHRLHGIEARYRALVENSRDLITILGPDLSIRYVSPSIRHMLGYAPEEKLGADAGLEFHPEDEELVQRELGRLMEDADYISHLQYRVRHHDGSWRILDTVAQNCFNQPHIHGLVVNSRDVTDLHAAEAAALDTARRLERTLGALQDAVFTVETVNRTIVDCNPTAERMFGYPRDELTGQSTRILHVDDRSFERFDQESVAPLQRGEAFLSEFGMRRRDGSSFPADVSVTLLNPHRGIEGGVVSVIHDRSERVVRERQVRFQAALLQQVGQPVVAVDEASRVTYWNEAAERLTGWTSEEAMGMDLVDLLLRDDQEIASQARENARTEARWEGEVRWRRKDGGHAIVHVLATPGVKPDGSPGGRIVAGVDIRERRELEDQLRQAQKMEAIGRLAGGVAHDFNNLLTAIEGHASLLLEDMAEDSPYRVDLEEILKSGRRAADLTRQLLAFSRKQVLEERKVDLNASVLDLQKMLERLVPERIEFEFETSSVPAVVHTDPGQLHQVVVNLVVNAVDAVKDSGSITVRTDLVELSPEEAAAFPWGVEPGWYASLSVTDTGTGIQPEAREHLFEPFFTTKPEGSGTGLGLATVYGIVKQTGGHVVVDSELGSGTTFRILLPRVGTEPDPVPQRPQAPVTTDTAVILLVEDDDAVRHLARRILERSGHTIIEAANGREALELAGEDVDLVITDVVMPDIGGVELQKRLTERYPDLNIIFTSGYSEADLRGEVRSLGNAFLPKPFTPDTLSRAVARALSKGG